MRRLAFVMALAFFVQLAEVQAYWGYVPIRPANPKQWCYKEPDCYLGPGVIHLQGKCYDGRDDLTDLGNDIRVVTEIVNPTRDQIWLTEQDAASELEFELKCVGINIQSPLVKPEDPYRPILHLLIYVYPLPNGYVVMSSLRLLEKDDSFKRGGPGQGEDWQVITWERQCMFYSCIGSLHCEVKRHARHLADQFTRKWVLQNRKGEFKKNKHSKQGAVRRDIHSQRDRASDFRRSSSSCNSCQIRSW